MMDGILFYLPWHVIINVDCNIKHRLCFLWAVSQKRKDETMPRPGQVLEGEDQGPFIKSFLSSVKISQSVQIIRDQSFNEQSKDETEMRDEMGI